MSDPKPQPGDKVRLIHKPREVVGEVEEITGAYITLTNGPGYGGYGLRYWDVEILERADDPYSDPIGTIRGSGRYMRLRQGIDGKADWWGVNEGRWVNPTVAGADPITGALPGTPAAQALELEAGPVPRERSGLSLEQQDIKYGREPLVVQYGDPEPERSKVFLDSAGDEWRPDCLGHWTSSGVHYVWNEIPKKWFPLREVVGP